jgi:hypothetical protein
MSKFQREEVRAYVESVRAIVQAIHVVAVGLRHRDHDAAATAVATAALLVGGLDDQPQHVGRVPEAAASTPLNHSVCTEEASHRDSIISIRALLLLPLLLRSSESKNEEPLVAGNSNLTST